MFLRESRVALNSDRRAEPWPAFANAVGHVVITVVENHAAKGYPWAELRNDQPGPAERVCFGECLQPFELGKLPPNFLKVGTKVTGALERAKDEGPLDHFAFLTCLTCDNSSSASDAMRASASLAGSTESSAIWRAKVSI
jgi:hypothetical protein